MALELISREVGPIGLNAYQVTEEYRALDADIATHEAALLGSTASGYSGITAPICQSVRSSKSVYAAGQARIVATYQTLDWDAYLLKNPDHGKVYINPSQSSYPRIRDLDGKILNGNDSLNIVSDGEEPPNDVPGNYLYNWRVDYGENVNIREKHSVTVRAVVATTATYITAFEGKAGYVNSDVCAALNGGAVGTLLFLGMTRTPIIASTTLTAVEYHFIHSATPWNTQCEVEKYLFRPYLVPKKSWVRTPTGFEEPTEIAGAVQVQWIETLEDGAGFSARLFPTTAFTAINGMVV